MTPLLAIGTPSNDAIKTKTDVLVANLIDSTIVAGIASISQYAAGAANPSTAAIAFGLTFLIKLKDLRGIP